MVKKVLFLSSADSVRAQMAVGLQLARGQIELQLPQINRTVVMGIGGVDQAAGKYFTRSGLCRWSKSEQCTHGEGVIVAVDPLRVGRAVDSRVKAQMLKGRVANHL